MTFAEQYGELVMWLAGVLTAAGVVLKLAWPAIAAGIRKLVKAASPQTFKTIKETAVQTKQIAEALPRLTMAIDGCTGAVRALGDRFNSLENRVDDHSKKHAVIEDRYRRRGD